MSTNSVPPTTDAEFRDWVDAHAALWADATGIGLSSAQKTAYTAAAADLSKKWKDLLAAEAALKDAQDGWKNAKRSTRSLTMDDLGIIRRFALTQSNPQLVYNAAGIPAPKTPVDGVLPGQPNQFKATLNTVNGNLKLTWKCVNPTTTNGTIYVVQRRIGTSGNWTQVALTSTKTFTDTTVPSAPIVQYQVQAQRSGIFGLPSQPVNVAFGHGSSGETVIASVTESKTKVKMAA